LELTKHLRRRAIALLLETTSSCPPSLVSFISAQEDMAAVGELDQRDPQHQAKSEAVAKKNGFKDFAEYDEVAANILMLFAGIDPENKRYTHPESARPLARPRLDRRAPPAS